MEPLALSSLHHQYTGNFYDILVEQARRQPMAIAYRFIRSDAVNEEVLTYGKLLARVEGVVATMPDRIAVGDRVLIAMPSCSDFVVAFLACQALGAISVPVPQPTRNRYDARLENIIEDAQPVLVFTVASVAEGVKSVDGSGLNDLPLVSIDEIEALAVTQTELFRNREADTIAFLQYTSGSTGEPKGVCISNGNLVANSRIINGQVPDGDNIGVLWLPLFHDMGLIGGMLQPLYAGFPVVVFPPAAFLMQPSKWLKLISEYSATMTVAPNFALDLCADKVSDELLEEIDLSSLKVLLCGAEPIQTGTLARFAATYAKAGFSKDAFCPVYGLAEATLMVSGKPAGQAYLTQRFERDSIASVGRHARLAEAGSAAVDVVSCGVARQSLAIVDPDTSMQVDDGQVGEIWVSGDSVAPGYWQRPEQSAQVFDSTIAGGQSEDGFLRTGDLGFLDRGELYVTGRIKDLIIIRGRNVYPQDIERLASTADLSLSTGVAAAFTADVDDREELVVAVEVSRKGLRESKNEQYAPRLVNLISRAVLDETGVSPGAIVLLRPNQLRRTSSGKVRRAANREAFLANEFKLVHQWQLVAAPVDEVSIALPLLRTRAQHEDWVVARLAERCSLKSHDIALDQAFVEFGLDSMAAVELVNALQKRSAFGEFLDVTALWDYPTIGSLVEHICGDQQERPKGKSDSATVASDTNTPASSANDEVAQLKALLDTGR